MNAPVDVVSVLVKLASLGGVAVPKLNLQRATSTIRSHLRSATTAQVRSALRKAERAGDVVCCAHQYAGWNPNAADRTELYWRVSDSTLASVEGGEA